MFGMSLRRTRWNLSIFKQTKCFDFPSFSFFSLPFFPFILCKFFSSQRFNDQRKAPICSPFDKDRFARQCQDRKFVLSFYPPTLCTRLAYLVFPAALILQGREAVFLPQQQKQQRDNSTQDSLFPKVTPKPALYTPPNSLCAFPSAYEHSAQKHESLKLNSLVPFVQYIRIPLTDGNDDVLLRFILEPGSDPCGVTYCPTLHTTYPIDGQGRSSCQLGLPFMFLH